MSDRRGGAHWRNLANTIKSSVCSGDAAFFCQITLTTCYGRPIIIGQAIIFLPCGFFFMIALWNRADHYILPCGFFFFHLSFFFFPRLISPSQIGCLPYFHTWCGLSANLRCRPETCCTRLAGNTGSKSRQKSPSGHHRTTLSGYRPIFATKARIDNRFKQN